MVIGDNGRGMTMTCSDEGDSCGDDDHGVMAMAMFNMMVMAIVMLMVMCMVSGGV